MLRYDTWITDWLTFNWLDSMISKSISWIYELMTNMFFVIKVKDFLLG